MERLSYWLVSRENFEEDDGYSSTPKKGGPRHIPSLAKDGLNADTVLVLQTVGLKLLSRLKWWQRKRTSSQASLIEPIIHAIANKGK